MDTHDTAAVGYDRPLRAGVALTVEPGLYLPPDTVRFGRFAGIGVRVEDDVVVCDSVPEVLSADVPANAHELEALVGTQAL
jgi:Xaa-Pro aminopeptidase